jgi:pteridine reductase
LNPENKQVALVTGGARRIGAAIVKHLHRAGYTVIIHCYQALTEAHALAVTLNETRPDSAFVLQRELTNPNSPAEIMAAINDWTGRLDLLVNNASVFMRTDWDLLFNTNVKAPFLLSLAARPFLEKQAGAIINLTDIHAEKPLSGYSMYCQSKAALEMQTKSLALEFAPNIRVNAIAPGAAAWPEKSNSLTPEIQQKIIAKTLLKKPGTPEVIAQAVLALAENSFITGQILKVDGGRSVVG